MSTPDPQALVAIETALGYTLTQEWARPMSKIAPELLDLISTQQWASARSLIDSFHLQHAVENAKEQIEELAISSFLFGASQAAGSVGTTSYVADEQPLPEAISQAIGQLDLALKYTGAEEIRYALHLMVNEAEELEKQRLLKFDPADGLQTLYVYRPLLNSADIWAWMKEQGFPSMLDQSDLHVTCCFSREPLDWTKAPTSDETIMIAGGLRSIEVFGSAIVLTFESNRLQERHQGFRDAGASYDFDEYRPHVTLTYAPGDLDLSKVQPFTGDLVFGAEVYQPVNLNWKGTVQETAILKAETMTLADRLNAAVLEGKALIDINANLTTSRLISLGFLSEAVSKNITTYQVNEVLDDRTCPICQMMHGKTFTVMTEYSKIVTALSTTDPTELKNIAPWPSQKKTNVALLASKSNEDLQAQGLGSPPYHPLCRGYLVTVGTVTEDTPMLGIKPPVDMSWVSKIKHADKMPAEFKSRMEALNMTEDDFIMALTGKDDYEHIHLRVSPLDKTLKITAKNGSKVKVIERTIAMTKDYVDHELFEIFEHAQGSGFAKKTLIEAVALYKALGIARVRLLANINVGGYAWAKYGFRPDADEWEYLSKENLLEALPSVEGLTDDAVEAIEKLLKNTDPKALWALADSVYGKQLLLGSNWSGYLYLDDTEAMARFNSYAGK